MSHEENRQEYTRASLAEINLLPNPVEQFRVWFAEATTLDKNYADAMTLATATSDGKPSARVVLLRGFDADGFVFYTNYDSRKGLELKQNPRASLNFFWAALERQVRIEGAVVRVSSDQSDSYFKGRPRGSQASAVASLQSQEVANRQLLEEQVKKVLLKYENIPIPRPSNWGGFRLIPVQFEFWQGRPNRLHDRICYCQRETSGWEIKRLSP